MKTHCPHGHAYAGDNLVVERKTGARRCRACLRAQHEARKIERRRGLLVAVSKGGSASAVALLPRIGDRLIPLSARFWSKVHKGRADECWHWAGATMKGGYGRTYISREIPVALAHRLAWVLTNERDPAPGMLIRHTCDNPICCNPAHLRPGTDADNVADMVQRGRQRPGGRLPARFARSAA